MRLPLTFSFLLCAAAAAVDTPDLPFVDLSGDQARQVVVAAGTAKHSVVSTRFTLAETDALRALR